MGKIAHLSDLHIGRTPHEAAAAIALRDAVLAAGVDHVIVTGDITDRGRADEYAVFNEIFGSLKREGRLIIVPGNHDRRGDGVAKEMMDGPRVDLVNSAGFSVIRIDSTGWHNWVFFASHGYISRWIIAETDRLLRQIPANNLVVVALHHHLLPLPEEMFVERVATWMRLPFAAELTLGRVLLEKLHGRADLVLHGHRHVPAETEMPEYGRVLRVFNAGSSTALGSFRVFTYQDGKLVGPPVWVNVAKKIT